MFLFLLFILAILKKPKPMSGFSGVLEFWRMSTWFPNVYVKIKS